jgi:uncharacterized protein
LIIKYKDSSLTIEVQVHSKSSHDEISGIVNGRLKVKASVPPVGGKANHRLKEIISRALGLPISDVNILRGKTSRIKVLRIEGVTQDKFYWFRKTFEM